MRLTFPSSAYGSSGLAIVAAAILLVKTRKVSDEKVLAYGVICFVISAFLFVSYLALGDVYVQTRHSAVLFAPAIILIGLVFDRISAERKILPAALAIIFLVFFSYSVYSLYPNLTKRGDWARVAEFIRANEKPGQPIVVFTVFDTLALPYYYHGQNKVLPDEKYFAWEPEAPFGTEASLQRQTDFVISEIPPDSQGDLAGRQRKVPDHQSVRPFGKFCKSELHYYSGKRILP